MAASRADLHAFRQALQKQGMEERVCINCYDSIGGAPMAADPTVGHRCPCGIEQHHLCTDCLQQAFNPAHPEYNVGHRVHIEDTMRENRTRNRPCPNFTLTILRLHGEEGQWQAGFAAIHGIHPGPNRECMQIGLSRQAAQQINIRVLRSGKEIPSNRY